MTTADLVAAESERRRAAAVLSAPLVDVLTSMAVLSAMLPAEDGTLAPVRGALGRLDTELRSAGARELPGSIGLDWSAEGPDPATMRFSGPADSASVSAMVAAAREWATAAAAAVLVYGIANPPASGPGIVTRIHTAAVAVCHEVRNGLMTWARSLPGRLGAAMWRWLDFGWAAVTALGRALGGGAALFGGGFATALLLGLLLYMLTRKG